MPVIECSCGMVMSIARAKPRRCCIRCGGVEFRLIEKWQAVDSLPLPFLPFSTSADCAPLRREVATIAIAVAEPIGEGAYI